MSKSNKISILLTIYLIVLAVIAFPDYQKSGDWVRYILIVVGQLLIILLVRYLSLKNEQKKKQRRIISSDKNAD